MVFRRIRFLLFAVMFLPLVAFSQRTARPPVPYVDNGACPLNAVFIGSGLRPGRLFCGKPGKKAPLSHSKSQMAKRLLPSPVS